ncbi:DUF6233 domain-containing protein [Streptomyces sp. NPDC088729]|uniref:DUF6233 domain-containing protein n=1 Tax=Streptomyces sp. NPDC088729 TaxID=3365876 RepID=UPI003807B92A
MPGGDVSDLDKNRALVDWLRYQLRYAESRVRELEAAERRERRQAERARAEQSWKIQPQRSNESALLHRGGCALYEAPMGFVNRREALIALADPDIRACAVCRPETGLREGARAVP